MFLPGGQLFGVGIHPKDAIHFNLFGNQKIILSHADAGLPLAWKIWTDGNGDLTLSRRDIPLVEMDRVSDQQGFFVRAYRYRNDAQYGIFTIDGRLGVGTDWPLATLQLYTPFDPDPNRANPEIRFASGGGTNGLAAITSRDGGQYDGGLLFRVKSPTIPTADNWPTGVLDAMYISSRGSVGINTVTPHPEAKLEVNGNTYIHGGFLFYDPPTGCQPGDVLTVSGPAFGWVVACRALPARDTLEHTVQDQAALLAVEQAKRQALEARLDRLETALGLR